MKKYILTFSLLFIISCQKSNTTKLIITDNLQSFALTNKLGDSIIIKNNQKPKVFFALDPECPLCQSYSTKINQLHNTYKDKVDFYAFFPTLIFSEKKVHEFIKKYQIQMELIIDTNQVLTYFLDAKITPECFLVDKNLNIMYHGLIDDWIKELGRKGQHINHEYLMNGIDLHLKSKTILNKKTHAIGCIIERL